MDKTIVVTAALRKRFETAWAQKQVILFCAPCGFGKTTTGSRAWPWTTKTRFCWIISSG